MSPLSCTVTETLNGEWELTLEHPLDDAGKWKRLVEGYILRAPVPAAMTPGITIITQATPEVKREIWKVKTNGSRLMLRSGTGTKYKIIGKYKNGTKVVLLEKTTSSWYKMLAPDGKQGYMSTDWLQYVRTEVTPGQGEAVNEVVEPRQLRDQPFRIYRVVPELSKITVYARHVFYDLMDNMIRKYEPSDTTTGANVAQGVASSCLSEHDFTFYSDLDSTAEEVLFENVNPVDAILGDGGLIEKYGGELARDWFDVFLVRRVGSDTDVQIRQGKNLLGVSYDVDLTDVVTRILPTGEDKDGNVLYLPEVCIDSPNLGNYPHPKWIHLPVSEAKEVAKGEDKKTKSQCYTEMRNAAQAEYANGCDLPTVTLKVDFINCAETEEYRDYKPLQNIFLGDSVRVVAPRIGVEVSMRMTQYTYDCLTRKYTAMTLGTVADTLEGNTISARQLPSGIITGTKLAINSVGTGALQSGSVGALQIQMAAIQTAHIETAAITSALIAEAAINNAHIANAEITAAKIADATITAAQIARATITAACIADATITAAQIADASITAAKIALATITEANIAEAAIGTAQIADLAVTAAKIANATITSAKIAEATIQTAHIQDAAITRAKIALLAVDEAQIANLAVGTAKIRDASVSTAKIQTSRSLPPRSPTQRLPTRKLPTPPSAQRKLRWEPSLRHSSSRGRLARPRSRTGPSQTPRSWSSPPTASPPVRFLSSVSSSWAAKSPSFTPSTKPTARRSCRSPPLTAVRSRSAASPPTASWRSHHRRGDCLRDDPRQQHRSWRDHHGEAGGGGCGRLEDQSRKHHHQSRRFQLRRDARPVQQCVHPQHDHTECGRSDWRAGDRRREPRGKQLCPHACGRQCGQLLDRSRRAGAG